VSPEVDELIGRLAAVERRLADHAAGPIPSALTEPDPGGGERWEAGQVWAHLAEFPGYWLGQVRAILAAPAHQVPQFGRTASDPGRIAAIERDRHTDPPALLARVRASLGEVSEAVGGLSPDDWRRRGSHPTRGELTVEGIVERFIVAHLEEHADQLDLLVQRAGESR
jgi:hypothetical protein